MRTIVSAARSRTVAGVLIAAMVVSAGAAAVALVVPTTTPSTTVPRDVDVSGAAARFADSTLTGSIRQLSRVDTRRAATGAVLGFSVPAQDDRPVVVVALRGQFTAKTASRPAGTEAVVILDADTLAVLDWGLADAPAPLDQLGSARVLITA